MADKTKPHQPRSDLVDPHGGTFDPATPSGSDAPEHRSERPTAHEKAQTGADVRPETLRREDALPEGLRRERKRPLGDSGRS
jgi:hypothetical protein